MTLKQSIRCKRTFSAWFYEYKQMCVALAVLLTASELAQITPIRYKISRNEAKLYYDGGYSPKMVFHEINRIPVGWDVL